VSYFRSKICDANTPLGGTILWSWARTGQPRERAQYGDAHLDFALTLRAAIRRLVTTDPDGGWRN